MKNVYSSIFIRFFYSFRKAPLLVAYRKVVFSFAILLFFLNLLLPSFLSAQGLIFSYSYQNVTRNVTGGTLENNDIIEVHALVKVDKTANSFYYIDTIRSGTQFVNGSLKIVTNEGLNYLGPYTDASGDDKGVYDGTGSPRIRINLGTGASNPVTGAGFGSTSGGGTVTPGDKPKFYGKTLFMVSYRLKITASFGDTIHLTGNYYFDTSGTKRTYRFNYPGIKIIKNSRLCNNFSSASFTADSSFKEGTVQNRLLPAIVPGYTKKNLSLNAPNDNFYSIANNTSADGTTDNTGPYKPTTNNHRVFGGFWDIIGDHTNAADPALGNPPVPPGTNGGYMLVVNAAYPTGEAYRQTIYDVCPNTNYEFSAWVRNICGYCGIDVNGSSSYTPGVLPNLSFAVNDVDYYTSGDIPYTQTWQKRGFMYKTGLNETSFTISIKNNAAGGGGNDWVLDDIKLVTCYPNLIMNPSGTATACEGWPITLSDTVKSYFDNYVHYRWEKSVDGINWNPVNIGSTKVPHVENGLYVYYIDTVIVPALGDSGTFFRVKVATTSDNLSDENCGVDNSQSILLKVYSSGNCPILDAKILNFSGAILNNKASLKWESQNENDLKEYEIEKSMDGIHFIKVGKLAATKTANGSTYVFNDPDAIDNTAYFRLKLINEHNIGNKYSKIISLYDKNASFKVTPVNPFRDNIKVEVFLPSEGDVEFNLCDIYGNVVARKMIRLHTGNSQALLNNLNNLPVGLYVLRTIFNGVVAQDKLIKTY